MKSLIKIKTHGAGSIKHGTESGNDNALEAEGSFDMKKRFRTSRAIARACDKRDAHEKFGPYDREAMRIGWLKKRHKIAKLKRQFPEVDFDAPDRASAVRRRWSKANEKRGCAVRQK